MNTSHVIDMHVHPLPNEVSSKDILREMELSGVVKAVLLAMDLDHTLIHEKKFKKDLENSLKYSHIYDIDPIVNGMELILKKGNTPNSHVASLVRENKDKFIGFGSVHIGHKSKKYISRVLQEIKEYVDELDFRGVKLLPTLQFFNPEKNSGLQEVFRFAEKHDLIVMYHTGCDPGPWEIPLISQTGHPKLIEQLIRKYNSVKVVLAHTGSYSSKHPGIWFHEAVELMKKYDNVFGDLSAVPFLITQEIFSLQLRPVIDKILYGSDYPVTSAGKTMAMSSAISQIRTSTFFTNEEKEKMFYKNAEGILDREN